jgi:hypothetical protein
MIASATNLSSNHSISSLPYTSQKSYLIDSILNTSLDLFCVTDNCAFTTPSEFTLNFSNTTQKNITFNISLPSNVSNAYYTDIYGLRHNGSNVSNFSLSFNYNVSVPVIPVNISSLRFSPLNNSYFGQFDSLPSKIIVNYSGHINYSNSIINLYHNGNPINWFNFSNTSNSFTLSLTQILDGNYEGFWVLRDNQNITKYINYSFSINQEDPPAPISISLEKGRYKSEVRDIVISMDSLNYSIYYLFNDGYPPIGSSNWVPIKLVNNQYMLSGFNFGSANIGHMYLKVIDIFGNIAIYPTGIISAPSINIEVENRIRSIEPGDEVFLDVDLSLKKGSGSNLRCKLDNFVAYNSDSDYELPVKAHSSLRNTNDDNYIDLYNTYEETLKIPANTISQDLEFSFRIPLSVRVNEDYRSVIECIIV